MASMALLVTFMIVIGVRKGSVEKYMLKLIGKGTGTNLDQVFYSGVGRKLYSGYHPSRHVFS